MKKLEDTWTYSPSDLITFMESPFASYMERWRLSDLDFEIEMDKDDPLNVLTQTSGLKHEAEFLADLKQSDKQVAEIKDLQDDDDRYRATIEAMESGAEVIFQAYLRSGDFAGYADFLVRKDGPSKFGNYHYEVWDTKLSKKLKPYFAIQLCCYAEMLEDIQGVRPNQIAIVLGSKEIKYLRTDDYFAYYQALKNNFLTFQNNWQMGNLPDPAESASHGRWASYAEGILANRRHLSIVANIRRGQIKKLEDAGIKTIDDLANTDIGRVSGIDNDVFARLKAQAALQIASEGQDVPQFSVLPHDPEKQVGLTLLPPHSPNDVFFDIEGFPLIDGGLEYLWGNTYYDDHGGLAFKDFWAHDHAQEKQSFINFIDWIFARWRHDPSMHVYHYASYEITAIRKLMGRYGVKEHEVDTLLRHNVFIDLYKVVRHGILVGETSYSIKKVEHLYRGKRDTDVASGGESVVVYQKWREAPDGDTYEDSQILNDIRDYNIDDCDSTQELAVWLRTLQADHDIAYIAPEPPKNTAIEEEANEVTDLRDALLHKADATDNEDRALLIRNLAWFLEFHKRENKPTWWRLFDRQGMLEIDLHDDMDCLVNCTRTDLEPYKSTPKARQLTYQYAFDPDQPFKGTAKEFYILNEGAARASRVSIDFENGLIDLKCKKEPSAVISLIPDEFVNPNPIPGAIAHVVGWVVEHDFTPCAITDFLERNPPRFKSGPRSYVIPREAKGNDLIEAVTDAVFDLDDSYLCIQGPPGSGKTYTAKHVICSLLKAGKKVGVASNSHKAITNLLSGVADLAEKQGLPSTIYKAGGDDNDALFNHSNAFRLANVKGLESQGLNPGDCFGGTAWAFCNDLVAGEFDYLFVDEAGQVATANLVGMSQSTKNLIVMGDQMQLGQPIQGSHPDNSGESILTYLLQNHSTIPAEMGVFLPETYRMHPSVCSIISNQVYDDRLSSADSAKRHQLEGDEVRNGVIYVPVEHDGNQQGSAEEVAAIVKMAHSFLGTPYWSAKDGGPQRKIGWSDMLFIAPYNLQVNELRKALPDEARVGSVDLFQGQEAPIVFVSMCSSDAAESPRGIDFLFSKNRLNVAISRAQALAIVVGSPRLATTPVNNLDQMGLVNFFARISTPE